MSECHARPTPAEGRTLRTRTLTFPRAAMIRALQPGTSFQALSVCCDARPASFPRVSPNFVLALRPCLCGTKRPLVDHSLRWETYHMRLKRRNFKVAHIPFPLSTSILFRRNHRCHGAGQPRSYFRGGNCKRGTCFSGTGPGDQNVDHARFCACLLRGGGAVGGLLSKNTRAC